MRLWRRLAERSLFEHVEEQGLEAATLERRRVFALVRAALVQRVVHQRPYIPAVRCKQPTPNALFTRICKMVPRHGNRTIFSF